ncbi:hypothetical protein ATANTOWER_029895, partial [Ataeniobius toweri]|nr:hypothetical protein [Ataeniobius toweri]
KSILLGGTTLLGTAQTGRQEERGETNTTNKPCHNKTQHGCLSSPRGSRRGGPRSLPAGQRGQWAHTRDSLSITSHPAQTLLRPPVLGGEERALGEAESEERGETQVEWWGVRGRGLRWMARDEVGLKGAAVHARCPAVLKPTGHMGAQGAVR